MNHEETWKKVGEATGSAIARRGELVVRKASEIEPRPIDWLWRDVFACNKLSLIAGHPGLGKSTLAIDIAATISKGGTFPKSDVPCIRGNVVLLSAEDDAEDTLIPRLNAAAADLERVHILEAVRLGLNEQGIDVQRGLCLQEDIGKLDKLVGRIGSVRLVVIDPISAYLGNIDSHNNADVRGVLKPLSDLARKHNCAVLIISHLNKSNGEVITRISGSHAFVAAARSAYVVTKDPSDSNRRLLLPIKNNLGGDKSKFAFQSETTTLMLGGKLSETARIQWSDELVEIDVEEAMAPTASRQIHSALHEAKAFLLDALEDGKVGAREIKEEAQEAGIAIRTMQRAKKQLGVKSKKAPDGGWIWTLPKAAGRNQDCQERQDCQDDDKLVIGSVEYEWDPLQQHCQGSANDHVDDVGALGDLGVRRGTAEDGVKV